MVNDVTSVRSMVFKGEITAIVDGSAQTTHVVARGEAMGNGAKKADGTPNTSPSAAATLLYSSNPVSGGQSLATPLPARTLEVTNLFPNTVVFPFDQMPRSTREALSTCSSR